MKNDIFRKKSLERINSPEQLNDYIRVSNPAVWMVLTAIILLIAGACVWGVCGHLETRESALVEAQNGVVTGYVTADAISGISAGMPVHIGDTEGTVANVSDEPVLLSGALSDEAASAAGAVRQGLYYPVNISASLGDGTYKGEIVTESISPMSFLIN